MLIYEQDHSKEIYRKFKTSELQTSRIGDLVVGENNTVFGFGDVAVTGTIKVEEGGEFVCLE